MSILNGSTLTLYGSVGDCGYTFDGFTAKDVIDALASHGDGDLTINLNSGGGLALEGLAIFNQLKNHRGRVTINIDAIAASAASLIAMAGDDIVMRDGAVIMIHDPRTITAGTSEELRKSASNLDVLKRQFQSVYAKRSGLSDKRVGDMMSEETWLDAETAIKLGFATSRSDEKAERATAFVYSLYQNTPPAILAANHEEVLMSTVSTSTLPAAETEKAKPWTTGFYASAVVSGVSLADLNTIVAGSETREQARDALIAKMAERNANLPNPNGGHWNGVTRSGGETLSNPDFLAKSVGDALYARMSGKAPEGAAREFMGRSALDMGAALLQSRGERVSFASRYDVAGRVLMAGSHSTSDFPTALQSSAHRVLLDSYKAAESELKKIAKPKTAVDFRTLYSLRMSEMPSLDVVEEGGEVLYGSRVETVESFRIAKYAKTFALTIEALVNDDLGALADSSTAFGRAAASREADLFAALFTANSGNGLNMADGAPLYGTGATRLNKAASGGALSVTTLGAGRQAMRDQKGLDGTTPLNITPKHLVVGSAQETLAEQLLHTLNAVDVSDVNPFAGKLALHVEPRLPGNAWRLFADPAELATIVMAHLAGTDGPRVRTREGWNVLGMEIQAVLYFGCGIESAKGTYLNPGA